MIDLNNLAAIKKLDPKNVYGSTEMLANQCSYIWDLAKSFRFQDIHTAAKNIILCGMGGSQYGSYVIQNLFRDELQVPLVSYGDYHLPAFINKNSLVFFSSYSGDTEEPVNCAQEAVDKGFPMITLTSGGKAYKMAKKYGFPMLFFDQKYNPSGQPRLGTGYMVIGAIALITRLGYLSVTDDEIENAVSELRSAQDGMQSEARELAQKIAGYIPVFFAAEFLNGNIHILRNQINETAKSFSSFSELPELNHHLMEGLKNPVDKKLVTVFIDSDFYSEKLRRRFNLTKDILDRSGANHITYKANGKTKLSQMLNVLGFGGYLSFFLAMLYGQDPSLIPWVDYFKEKLAKTE